RIRDLTGGFKCYRRRVLETIDLDAVHSKGYAFQIETTYRTIKKGFRVVEIPIRFVDRTEGHSKMSRAIVLEAVTKVPALRPPSPPYPVGSNEARLGVCPHLDQRTFDAAVSAGPVVVDFWAPWCKPCRAIEPILEDLAERVTVARVNIDEEPELASRYEVLAI